MIEEPYSAHFDLLFSFLFFLEDTGDSSLLGVLSTNVTGEGGAADFNQRPTKRALSCWSAAAEKS